jgi:hypothetical protein
MSKNTDLGNLVNGLFVNSSGNVGVKNTNPTVALDVTGAGRFTNSGASDGLLSINSTFADGYRAILRLSNTHTGGKNWDLYSTNTGDGVYGAGKFVIRNNTDSVNALTITSAGNVGIGTTSPTYKLEVTNSTSVSMRLNNTGDSTDSFIQYDNTGSSFSVGAGANGWFFYTGQTKRYDFWIANVIRMQLASNGNLLIGTTTDNGNKLNVSGSIYSSSSIASSGGFYSDNGIVINYGYAYGLNSNNQVSGNGWYMQVSTSWSNNFRFFYGGTGVGQGSAKFQIDTGGGYTGISDINKKKDIALSTLGLAEVMQLKPSTFKFKDDENQEEQIGFIAQEVKDIIPQAYYEDKEGDDKFIGLKQAAFIPVLVKAIQELKAEIEILKQK